MTLVLPAIALVLAAAWPARQFARAYLDEQSVFHPPVGPVALPAEDRARGLSPIVIPNGEARIAAWYAAPRAGMGSIVLCGGTGSTRASLLAEARALMGAGFGVLLFDWPGHGESTGVVDLGEGARQALRRVLDAARSLPGSDASRIGVYAFSYGGVTAVPVVASDTSVRALVVAAAPFDSWEQMTYANRDGGRFAIEGARWFWSRRGEDFAGMRLAPVAAKLAPRPVLVVIGGRDPIVDPADADRLVQAIGPSATLWRIDGAWHGGYEQFALDFDSRLIGFFEHALQETAAPAGVR